MAAIGPAIATITAKIGAVAAAVSTAAPAISAVSGVLGVVGAYQSAKANKEALEQQAIAADENAKRVLGATYTTAQDQDFVNLAALEDVTAQQASSGLTLNSASAIRTRRLNKVKARRDTLRIVDDGVTQAQNFTNQSESLSSQASQISPFMSAFTAGIKATSSVIGSYDSLNKKTRQKISGATA